MKYRLRRLARLLGALLIPLVVAAAAGAVAIFVTGPSGLVSCVPAALPATPDPIPRWVIAAGIPALLAAFVAAFIALSPERVFLRFVGLLLTAALAAGTFYAVYALLPAACRP